MPSALSSVATAAQLDSALDPLVTAAMHLTIKNRIMDFARAVFGTDVANDRLKATEEEAKGQLGGYANGGWDETPQCTSLMRSYVALRDQLGEAGNAEELKALASSYFAKDVVDVQLERVLAGH